LNDALQVCLDYDADKCAAWVIENGAVVDHSVKYRVDFFCHNISFGFERGHAPVLHIALERAMRFSVQALLRRGVNVEVSAGPDGMQPLHLVVSAADSVELCRWLVDHGANVNTANNDGISPLMLAARYKWRGDHKLQMMELLLAAGANINARSVSGQTALMFACDAGDPRRVQLLLDATAEVVTVDKNGRSACWYARSGKGTVDEVRDILRILADRGGMPSAAHG
jgi:ankyrin repeat protein